MVVKYFVKNVTMGLDNTAKHIIHVGSDRLSLIHVRMYISDEIQQLDLKYIFHTSLMDLLRDVQQCKQKCTF